MKIFRTALALSLISCTIVSAAPIRANENTLPTFIFARPERQPGSGTPDNLGTAISRGECPQLQAFIPDYSPVVPAQVRNVPDQSWGLTTSDAPTLWFRIDQPVSGVVFNLSLKTSNDTVIATQQKILSEADRFFSVSLPAQSLSQKDVFYAFTGSMDISCEVVSGGPLETISISDSGWVQRVDVPESLIETEDDKALALAYAEAGLWFDAFDVIARLYQQNPADEWVSAALAELIAKMEAVRSPQQ